MSKQIRAVGREAKEVETEAGLAHRIISRVAAAFPRPVVNAWRLLVHRKPEGDAGKAPELAKGYEGYDGSLTFFRALAPVVWLALVGVCLLVALGAVGYLTADLDSAGNKIVDPFKKFLDALPEANFAKRRSALAFSGVMLAITTALAVASLVWASAAFRGKADRYRYVVLAWVLLFFGLSVGILVGMDALKYEPFASSLANALLRRANPVKSSLFGIGVPRLMFWLGCLVPVVLAAGACFLLQPVGVPKGSDSWVVKARLQLLTARLDELDQLLYVGALGLVFGTLQFSAALSVSLVSMPNIVDLKTQADLCKTLPAASQASSPFFTPNGSKSSFYEGFDIERCRKLPLEFARVEVGNDLRQLTRGITIAIGLAFSALLAAIYVPGLVGLRLLIDPLRRQLPEPVGEGTPEKVEPGDVDPFRRIATLLATLSPLIAGLLANVFGNGG